MRTAMFLALTALAAAVGLTVDLQAGCRCNRVARREARQERKACRRGYSVCAPVNSPQQSGYQDQVQPVGSAAAAPRPAYKWQCDGVRCRLVPVPDPAFPAPSDPPPPRPSACADRLFHDNGDGTWSDASEVKETSEKPSSKAQDEKASIDESAPSAEPTASSSPKQPGDAPTWVRQLLESETEGQQILSATVNRETGLHDDPAKSSDAPRLVTEHITSDPPVAP